MTGRRIALTEKDLKKLNRYQLLEMLVIQTERADGLQKQLQEAQERLDARDVQMTVVGSIAEASLHLGGVFEAAQNAADIYMEAVKARAGQIEADATRRAEEILAEAERKAKRILEDARARNLLWNE